ncbi:thioesterase [Bacillus sp. DTU_2020_1000418_1_SI_GHA_SEK_038]|uniref:thioesterase family protein n=1 Tax=Bacillus sp. DTU_2020_1000418_1_SI_GHA_SEK_038 TaxID=3077585 RepID=UPI0028ECEDF2|nr:thioesterase [Bacillus sp. DTU_2020_1000418_1_SI_GHA_SEK_038]WNS77307.1 thioesterase [Bacillus sp. DTU_2020_1000418_1_SI_GHA_SEK_038]
MKPGLTAGYSVTIEAVVTREMFAQFEGKMVHPTYSTVMMIYHMEWASRQIILPFLEEHEEGMGLSVSAKHILPAREGSKLNIKAVLTEKKDNKIITDVFVINDTKLIGTGEVTQVILPKAKIKSMLA